MGAAWLLKDWYFTRLVRKVLARYQYHVVSVNETRRKFDLPGEKKPLISLIFTSTPEQTQFREVTFAKGDQTYTCLAALKWAQYKKPMLFFDIGLDTLSPKTVAHTVRHHTEKKIS